MKYGTFTSLSDLKPWFDHNAESAGKATWNLYHGFLGKTSGNNAQKCADQRDDTMSTDDSWNQLTEFITIQSQHGGQFTLYMHNNKGSNHGSKAFIEMPGSRTAPRGGVGGLNQTEVAGLIEKERELWELKREIEDIRAARESEKPYWQTALDGLLQSEAFPQLAVGILSRFVPADQVAGLMQGVSGETMPDPAERMPGSQTDEQARAAQSLNRIAVHFPDLAGFLENLAGFVEKNPKAAKQYFSMIEKSENETERA